MRRSRKPLAYKGSEVRILLSPLTDIGEVPERLNGHDWKSCSYRKVAPGFESLPLRLILCAVFVTGCSAIPLESSLIPHPSSRSGPAFKSRYREAVGVIHIHTTYSDGMLPIEPIAKIANAQGLDYLIITDHNTLQGRREGKPGWYGRTLVLVDEEISTRGGHYLALRLSKEVPRLQDPQWTIEAVSAQGGLGFIAHPFWPRRPWKNPESRGITGLEIYSAVHDVSEENILWMGLWTILTGSEFSIIKWLDREKKALDLWDRMLARGDRVVGIGSPDAHGLRRWGLRLGPYTTMFKLVRTHLLVRELSEKGIYDALRKGHAFVAHDLVADPRKFIFLAVGRNSVRGIMGDQVKRRPGLWLYAFLPSPGEMTLLKDGRVAGRNKGQESWFQVNGPGVYRLEAARKGKPWIYSNPIYVVE